MADQKVRITQLPTLNDGDDAVAPINKNNVDYKFPINNLLQVKNNLSEVDAGLSRANLGVYSKDEIDEQNKDTASGLRKDLASTSRGKGLSLVAAEDGTNGQQLFDEAVRLVGNYEDGPLTLTSENHEIRKGGIKYYPAPGLSLPYTTTGTTDATWEVDKAKFFIVGDKALRKDLSSDNDGVGDSLIAIKQPYSGAVARTQHDKNSDVLSAKDFGAKGDGKTDDTIAIQNAINSCAGVCTLYLPSGDYLVDTLYIPAYCSILGDYVGGGDTGGGSRLVSRSFNTVLKSIHYDEYMSNPPNTSITDYSHHVVLKNLTIDGGIDGVINSFSIDRSGCGIQLWGGDVVFECLHIVNCGKYGIQSYAKDMDVSWGRYGTESRFFGLRFRNIGEHGWYFDGPHDAKIIDVTIINAGQKANNTYDGFYAGSNSSSDIVGLHVSSSGNRTSNSDNMRHRYAANFYGNARVSASSFEGAYTAQVSLNTGGMSLDSSCIYYAPFGNGSCNMIELHSAHTSVIKGRVSSSGGRNPNMQLYGLVFDAQKPTTNCVIDLLMDGINTPVAFASGNNNQPLGDGGNNLVSVQAYYSGSQTNFGLYGVANTANGTKVVFRGSGSKSYYVDSDVYTGSYTMPSGATQSVTFSSPFYRDPIYTLTLVSPSSTPSGGVWLSQSSKVGCSIFNGTGVTVTVHITARSAIY